MFRITYNKEISTLWRSKKTPTDIQTRRVYRWTNVWAYANPWKSETRSVIQESEEYLVELCTPTSDQQPPYEVEDMWDEEIVFLPHIEYNGLLSLIGTQRELLEVMEREGLPKMTLPSLPSIPSLTKRPEQQSRPPMHSKYARGTKSKCLISD